MKDKLFDKYLAKTILVVVICFVLGAVMAYIQEVLTNQ